MSILKLNLVGFFVSNMCFVYFSMLFLDVFYCLKCFLGCFYMLFFLNAFIFPYVSFMCWNVFLFLFMFRFGKLFTPEGSLQEIKFVIHFCFYLGKL